MGTERHGPTRDRVPRKTPRRHAADVQFHLTNALRSLDDVRRLTRDPITRDFASRLAETLLDARGAVEPLIDAAASEQARRQW